jgi:hypothetical protein
VEITQLYKKLKQFGISPNEFTVLNYLYNNVKEEFNFNENLSKRILKKSGFLDNFGNLTEKAKNLFEDNNNSNLVEEFRNLFPKGILPNGKSARSTYQELDKKLKWFLSVYGYSWDVVLKATKEYVKYYAKQDYKFMQTASNFISKQDQDKIRSSTLAEWCEKILDGFEVKEEFDINV